MLKLDISNFCNFSVIPNRYPLGSAANGVLVGPGGPTGIIGRPQYGGNYEILII